MRSAHGWWVAVAAGLWLGLAGCGSSGGDRLTLVFLGFSGEGLQQSDAVRQTSADVDVCQGLCLASGQTAPEPEPFTQTSVNAVFVNRGKADIVLDRYTLTFPPESGVPPVTRSISALIPGGRCSDDPEQRCALDAECLGGQCQHQETTVNLLLYDFDLKARVRVGDCPNPLVGGEGPLPVTYDVAVVFSGVDSTEERFTVSTDYVSTFADFDNCQM